jgi:hypothetical protein
LLPTIREYKIATGVLGETKRGKTMRNRFSLTTAALACAVLLLSCGTMVRADSSSSDVPDNSELGLLRRTYHTLKIADHDYKGHRVKAMRSIEAACDQLGTDIRGDGKGDETQPVSDEQLRAAVKDLQKAHVMATQQNQPKVLAQVDKAIDELGRALGVK